MQPVGRQMAIKNSVSNDFLFTFVDRINVFDYCLSSVCLLGLNQLKLNVLVLSIIGCGYFFQTSRTISQN